MEELIATVEPYATARFVKKRAVLFYQGEIPRQAQIVREGLIKVYTITVSGEERIVCLHSKGDIFPLPWIFDETSNSLFYYEAVTDCEMMSLSKVSLLKVLASNPLLQRKVLQFVVSEYTTLLLHITALEQSRAAEKIGFTLYYLLFHYGQKTDSGTYIIGLKLTHPMIASLVGLSRESVVINLRLLKRKGIINFHHFTYEINKSLLEKFLGEDSFKDLPLR